MKTNSKNNNFFKGTALAFASMFLFATTVVQPVQGLNVIEQARCGTMYTFANAATGALDIQRKVMLAVFQFEVDALEATWRIQDQAIELHRSLSEAAHQALLAVYAAITAWTTSEKAAIQTYKTSMATALTVLRTKIDATRAAYREDTLALVKAHQKALTGLVDKAISKIKAGVESAKTNCGKVGTVAKIIGVIAGAKGALIVDGLAQQVTDLAKQIKLKITRNQGYVDAGAEYVKIKIDVTIKLMKATLGWRKETAAAQADIDSTKNVDLGE